MPAASGAPSSAQAGQTDQAGGNSVTIPQAGTGNAGGASGAVAGAAGMAGGGGEPMAEPDPVLLLNPAPSKTYLVVTAGQSNAGLRIDDGGLARDTGWDNPLDTEQNPLLQKALGALAVHDTGDRYGGELNTAVGGCGLIRSMDDCHFIDDLGSTDPTSWTLHGWGVNLLNNLKANKAKGDLVFVSWIQGEANAHTLNAGAGELPGSIAQGGPYGFATPEAWAGHYKQALKRFIVLLREGAELPKLRMGIQLIAAYDGFPDLIRQAQLDAIAESAGALVLENGNPWQWYRPISAQDGAHYDGQAYADFCLETGRALGFALKQAGNVDSAAGPGYGRFPAITGMSVDGQHIDLAVSNPNHASTLILPTQDPTRGFSVSAQGTALSITAVALSAPFTIRLTVSEIPGNNPTVTYGTEANHPSAGQAITDDAASASPADAGTVERRNMPLTVKPF